VLARFHMDRRSTNFLYSVTTDESAEVTSPTYNANLCLFRLIVGKFYANLMLILSDDYDFSFSARRLRIAQTALWHDDVCLSVCVSLCLSLTCKYRVERLNIKLMSKLNIFNEDLCQ